MFPLHDKNFLKGYATYFNTHLFTKKTTTNNAFGIDFNGTLEPVHACQFRKNRLFNSLRGVRNINLKVCIYVPFFVDYVCYIVKYDYNQFKHAEGLQFHWFC